jgi:hypothetical protein
MTHRPVKAAFNQGEVPTIACFNQATIDLGVDFGELVAAMQLYVDRHVAPVWGTPARLAKTKGFVKKAWAMVLLDDADQPGALAYHDLTPGGLPLAKVFVRTTLEHNELVSVSASHELVEMLVDPAINMLSTGPDGSTMYAYESADPVETLSFEVNGVAMSDFVYPSFFEGFRKRGSTRFDHMNKVKKPFEILPGGYQIIFKEGEWSQIFGPAAKNRRVPREDARREARGRRLRCTSVAKIARALHGSRRTTRRAA